MKLCVTSGIIKRDETGSALPFGAVVNFAKQFGFEELDLNFDTADLACDDWRARLEEKLLRIQSAGMRVKYIHLPYDYPHAQQAEAWEVFAEATFRGIRAAKIAGADCAAIHPRTFPTANYDPDREYDNARTFLQPFCEYAHRENVQLAVEIMRGAGASAPARLRRFGTDTEQLIRLVDELDEGICWDTGHANISLQMQRRSLLKIGSRLKMVHINDNFAEDDIHLAPFLGRIDWQETMSALREIGYAGSLNLEVSCDRLPEALRPIYASFMAESGRQLIRWFESAKQ